jgi:type IV pilus assembly protein PilW
MNTNALQRRKGSGFGLVEVMVAMLIGMITVVIIMQVVTGAESHRRMVTSGSDAGTAGIVALHGLQRDLMNAGYGLSVESSLYTFCGGAGGTVLGYNGARRDSTGALKPAIALPANVFTPVVINPPGMPAGDPNTDIIQISFGGSKTFLGRGVYVRDGGGAGQLQVVANPTLSVTLPTAGLQNGDLAIISHSAAGSCVLTQLSTIDSNTLITRSASVWNDAGDFNRGQSYPAGSPGILYGLGSDKDFVIRAYAVRSGRLTSCSPIFQDCSDANTWLPVAEGIVSLRAQYGVDTNNDDQVSAAEWTFVAPTVWENLKAVRVAIVSRSNNFEREVVTTDCTPSWAGQDNDNPAESLGCPGGAPAGQIVLNTAPDGANWNHYRYKLVQTTVPLRNLFWSNN